MGREQSLGEIIKTNEKRLTTNDIKKKDKKNKSLVFNLYGENTKRDKAKYNEVLAYERAVYLANKLHNPKDCAFYLKCAWNLTDAYLDRLLAISLTKTAPGKYFSRAAANEMRKNG